VDEFAHVNRASFTKCWQMRVGYRRILPVMSGSDCKWPTAGSGQFTTTHWTIVLQAGESGSAGAQEALSRLCQTYWPPLYAYVRREGYSPEDAQDLTQEFFYRFLQRGSLADVNPAAGKFRSYLLACLKHFLANERERAHAQRRGGGLPTIHLDPGDAETRYSLESADRLTPELSFDRQWAFTVIERALAALREEQATQDKGLAFEEIEGFLPQGRGHVSRADLAAKHGMNLNAIDVAIHRVRQRFGALLRREVTQTVSSASEVEEEIRYLISILGS
jgi:DNA-directed RNA polymerase specialized sigma24 family protein